MSKGSNRARRTFVGVRADSIAQSIKAFKRANRERERKGQAEAEAEPVSERDIPY
jgi:hypothetical protein